MAEDESSMAWSMSEISLFHLIHVPFCPLVLWVVVTQHIVPRKALAGLCASPATAQTDCGMERNQMHHDVERLITLEQPTADKSLD